MGDGRDRDEPPARERGDGPKKSVIDAPVPPFAQSPGIFDPVSIQGAAGNMALQHSNNGGDQAASDSSVSALWAQYPVLTRILPKDVLALHSSARINVPLRLLLRPGTGFIDRDIWDSFLANRRSQGSDASAAELLGNEMMRRYFAGKLSLNDPVQIEITPPFTPNGQMSLVFRVQGQEMFTPDGMFSGSDLLIFGPVEPVVAKVQRDASSVEIAGQLLDEIDQLESIVKGVLLDVRLEPKDFALNDILESAHALEKRILDAKKVLADWECSAGPALSAASNLGSRYDDVLSVVHDTRNFAKGWHKDNTMESAGQANKRRGQATGDWYDIPVAGFWALVETGEVLGTLGSHNDRTKIAEAFNAGEISWNEAAGLVDKSTRRALLTAALMGRLGPAAGRFGTGLATGLGMGRAGVATLGGAVGGGITSAGVLTSQTLLTKFGGGNLSQVGQDIWNSGKPSGTAWALGLSLGTILPGLQGARAAQLPTSAVAPNAAGLPPRTTEPPMPPQLDPLEPPVANSAIPQSPKAPGLLGKLAIWGRLSFGEPITRGASETNVDLMGQPTSIPGGSGTATSSSSPIAATPFASSAQPMLSPFSTTAPRTLDIGGSSEVFSSDPADLAFDQSVTTDAQSVPSAPAANQPAQQDIAAVPSSPTAPLPSAPAVATRTPTAIPYQSRKSTARWWAWTVALSQAIRGEGLATRLDERVDMPRGGSSTNARGWLRDQSFFFRRLLSMHPEFFSPSNAALIQAGTAPVVDQQWATHHPDHAWCLGETLHHHHLGGGQSAVALPESLHNKMGWSKYWHQ